MLTLSMAFLLLYLAKKWKWTVDVAVVLGVIGILSDSASAIINTAWMTLTRVLSRFVPILLLGVIFYGLVFPLSLLFRLLAGRDPLILKNRPGSTFQDSKKEFDKLSFERTW